MYKELFDQSTLTYTQIAYELGCTELTARNKINGKTRITKAEEYVLNKLFENKENKICITKSKN